MLRPVQANDVPLLYEHQADAEAAAMVGFAPRSRAEHDAHWARILSDDSLIALAIVDDAGRLAGHIASWTDTGDRLVGYWIDRELWGQGHATAALRELLELVTERPLVALVAETNHGSIRVLERCGFVTVGKHQLPGDPVVEVRMVLEDDAQP